MESEQYDSRDQRWRRVQAISGVAFAVFVLAHLGNTLAAIAGPNVYDPLQQWLGAVYQSPLIEIALLGIILPAHITAGIARARLRRVYARPTRARLVRYHHRAGWFLVAIVYWHAAAVRLPALLFDAPPGFAGVSFSIHWMPGWFYPYYFLLAIAGFSHMVIGTRLALPRLGIATRPPGRRATLAVIVSGAIAFSLALLAFGGVFFDVGDPFASDYARVYLGFLNGGSP